MRKAIFISALLFAAVSCQKPLIMRHATGAIEVHVDNSPVVDIVTKAGETVTADEFMVYVESSEGVMTYEGLYKDMPAPLIVPVGTYTVSAENVTEAAALEGWGQVRYYGASQAKEVKQGDVPTSYDFTCRMVNAAVSVLFDENIASHFSEYSVSVHTEEARKLVYNEANTLSAVGYFAPGTMTFEFSGKLADDGQAIRISGTKTLAAATHLNLTFCISQQNGSLKPEITVDATYEVLYSTVTIDPEDGSFDVTDRQ